MAVGAKGKGKPRRSNQQNSLFKRKKFCRFTAEHVEPASARHRDQARSLPRPSPLHGQPVIAERSIQMQVILLEKIAHLGELGDIVKVKDGYGRNFLIPQGHAKRATKAAIAEFEARRAELEKAQAERVAAAQELAAQLNGKEVTIASKCGVDGRLFGSVTNADIAEAVDALGFQIKKSQVRTPLGAIKATGDYVITIGLMTDITADITVKVVAEA